MLEVTSKFHTATPGPKQSRRRGGFTLIELLVVIGIILVLMAILLPVIGAVQLNAQAANTQSQMMRIMSACQAYYHDFNSYPARSPMCFLPAVIRPGRTRR